MVSGFTGIYPEPLSEYLTGGGGSTAGGGRGDGGAMLPIHNRPVFTFPHETMTEHELIEALVEELRRLNDNLERIVEILDGR